jgi:isopentenyldiphosphate isomerase
MDEMVAEVDERDVVVRVVSRARMRAERLMHRAVFIAVIDSAGRLLVHRRSDDKDVWPGWWDMAVGGVVAAEEDYADAAVREVREEIGVQSVPMEIGRGMFIDDSVAVQGRCYVVRHDGPFVFADGEVVEARFVTAAEFASLRGEVPFLPDSLALLLPLIADDLR